MKESPPTTFVPADDHLFPPLAHSGMWLALGIVAIIASSLMSRVLRRTELRIKQVNFDETASGWLASP